MIFNANEMKRYFTILNVLLIAGAAYFGVQVFYEAVNKPVKNESLSKITRGKVSTNKNKTEKPLSDYNAIGRRNLFKTPNKSVSKKESVDIEALEQTSLNLKLWGTVKGFNDESYAVIEDVGARTQYLYREDDPVQNAIVKMILREKVVLSVDGKNQILEMEQAQSGSPIFHESAEDQGRGKNRVKIKQSKIESAVKNVNDLMKQVRIRPHFTKGQPDGLHLSGIRPGSIFSQMGLKSGDVVTGVDGKKIESLDDALQFYKSLQSASDVKLEIKRRGKEEIIDYHVE